MAKDPKKNDVAEGSSQTPVTVEELPVASEPEVIEALQVRPLTKAELPRTLDRRELYWVGLLEACPADQISVGPVTFAKYTGVPTRITAQRVSYETQRQPGGFARLEKPEVSRLLETIRLLGLKVTRESADADDDVLGFGGRGLPAKREEVVGDEPYRAEVVELSHQTEPIAQWIWIAKLPESEEVPDLRGRAIPQPLLRL